MYLGHDQDPMYPYPQFLITAGGYLAEPLSSLVPEHMVQSDGASYAFISLLTADSTRSTVSREEELIYKLQFTKTGKYC
jgi:hypothetical protein